MQSSKKQSLNSTQKTGCFLFSQVILLVNVLMVMTAMVSDRFLREMEAICSFIVGGGRGGFSGRGL